MPRRKLPPSVLTEIRRLYSETGNGYEVARQLDISKSVVYKYLGLGKRQCRRWTAEEIERMVKHRALGKSRTSIAKLLGRTPNQVSIALLRYRRKILADPERRKVVFTLTKCFAHGLTPEQALKAIRKTNIIEGGY